MKSELSSLEVGVIVDEFRGLIGAKIDKIYQLKDKDVVLQLHKPSFGRIKVRLDAPRAAFLASGGLEFPERPPGFCQQLRKHLDGARLVDVSQLSSERIVSFSFSGGRAYELVVELFSKGNIILCGDVIIAAAERQLWSDRKVIPGERYSYPMKKCSFYSATAEDVLAVLGSSSKDSLVKALAMDVGLGGAYSEEVCLLSGIPKSEKPQLVGMAGCQKLVSAIRGLVSKMSHPEPGMVYDGASVVNVVPFKLGIYANLGFRRFGTFSSALEHYYSAEFRELSAQDKKMASLQRIISEQEEMLSLIESEISSSTEKADAIYRSYSTIREVLHELAIARKKLSWPEIKSRLKGHPVVKEVDESGGKIVVEVSER